MASAVSRPKACKIDLITEFWLSLLLLNSFFSTKSFRDELCWREVFSRQTGRSSKKPLNWNKSFYSFIVLNFYSCCIKIGLYSVKFTVESADRLYCSLRDLFERNFVPKLHKAFD